MGSLFKPSTQKTTTTNTPWGPQGDALKYGFGQLQNVIGQKVGSPYYQGDLYANMDPLTSHGIDANAAYANGPGAALASGVGASASGALPGASSGMSAYDQLRAMASTDPTQSNIASAGQYADNPWMNGMIDAASRDVVRNLNENELPGLNQAATGSGNINSSRAGVAEGIMRRGAADQIGDIASQLRGQAYQNGLGLAEGARTANMGGLGAAGSGYGDIYDLGLKGSALGQDLAFNNGNTLISGGQLNQQDQQGQLNADFSRWQGADNRDMSFLIPYMNAVGGIPGFGTSTASQPGPSPFQNLVGAGTSALGAYMMFSDPFLKTNIVPTGETTKDGIAIHEFDYKDDTGLDLPKGRQVGVIATDVAKVRPDAVGLKDGFLIVDYGKL